MTNEQLLGKYARLRDELAQAYAEAMTVPSRAGRIERLVDEITAVERRMAELQLPATLAEPLGVPAERRLAA